MRKMMFRSLYRGVFQGLLAVALATAGCALDESSEPVDELELDDGAQAIRNPTAVPFDQLLHLVEVTNADGGKCTGTLFAPDSVLTAAHCVCTEHTVGGNVCNPDVTVKFRMDPAVTAAGVIRPGQATWHPDYDPSWTEGQYEHDVAVVTLDQPAPGFVPPIVIAEANVGTGLPVLAAGRGYTGADCDGLPGTFNSVVTQVDDYEDGTRSCASTTRASARATRVGRSCRPTAPGSTA